MKTFTVEYAENGYILRLNSFVFVYLDEVELVQGIKEFLELEQGGEIEVRRKQ